MTFLEILKHVANLEKELDWLFLDKLQLFILAFIFCQQLEVATAGRTYQ